MTERQGPSGAASGRGQALLGGALVAAAGLMFALAGMGIKMVGESLSSFEVLFWRNVLSLVILAPWIVWHWPRSLRPAHSGLMAMRGVTLVAALICYYPRGRGAPARRGGAAQLQLADLRAGTRLPPVPLRPRRQGAGGGADRLRRRRPDPQAGNGVLSARGPDRTRVRHPRRAFRHRHLAHAGARGPGPHRRLLRRDRHPRHADAGPDGPDPAPGRDLALAGPARPRPVSSSPRAA